MIPNPQPQIIQSNPGDRTPLPGKSRHARDHDCNLTFADLPLRNDFSMGLPFF
jgi:hypothetical protein